MLWRLQRETEPFHASAAADRLSVMSSVPPPENYVAYLARIYGFEAPVEKAIAMTLCAEPWFDARGRNQIKLLRADLMVLGIVDPGSLPRCGGVVPFGSAATALGWMYVVERNALVHGLIERHLRSQLLDRFKLPGSYLAPQPRSSGTRWRELGEALDRVASDPGEGDAIIRAARIAFRCQHGWFDLAMPARQPARLHV